MKFVTWIPEKRVWPSRTKHSFDRSDLREKKYLRFTGISAKKNRSWLRNLNTDEFYLDKLAPLVLLDVEVEPLALDLQRLGRQVLLVRG